MQSQDTQDNVPPEFNFDREITYHLLMVASGRSRRFYNESIVNIPRFDCHGLAVKERLGQGSFCDIYTVDYEAPGKVAKTVVVKKILQALDQDEKKLFFEQVALL